MAEDMELKAYKMICEIQNRYMQRVRQEAHNKIVYKPDSVEDLRECLEKICSPDLWDKCSMMDAKDKHTLEVLQYLLNDEQKEVSKYKNWDRTK